MEEQTITVGMSEARIREIGREAHYGSGPTCEHVDQFISAVRSLRARVNALEVERDKLRAENDDLIAANITKLLEEIKQRLTPEEGEEFQELLMAGARGWMGEVAQRLERSDFNEQFIEAFKGHPKKKRHSS